MDPGTQSIPVPHFPGGGGGGGGGGGALSTPASQPAPNSLVAQPASGGPHDSGAPLALMQGPQLWNSALPLQISIPLLQQVRVLPSGLHGWGAVPSPPSDVTPRRPPSSVAGDGVLPSKPPLEEALPSACVTGAPVPPSKPVDDAGTPQPKPVRNISKATAAHAAVAPELLLCHLCTIMPLVGVLNANDSESKFICPLRGQTFGTVLPSRI